MKELCTMSNKEIKRLEIIQGLLNRGLTQRKSIPEYCHPKSINTDQNPAYSKAIAELKADGKCPTELEHRQIKYLNNIIESDHGKLKRLIKPTLGFKSMKTAYATIKGFEIMRMFKKGRFDLWKIWSRCAR